MYPLITRIIITTAIGLTPSLSLAQSPEPNSKGAQLGEMLTQRYKLGIIVKASGGDCFGIVEEDVSAYIPEVQYRTIDGSVRQMIIQIRYLPAGEEAHALLTVEVDRHSLVPPEDTTIFEIPKRLDRETRKYLAPSPGIETRHSKIKRVSREVATDKENAWETVEAIYDWVRENIEYRDQRFKGALAALEDGHGDCEELSSLFIAICRNNKIPARTVWVPEHCYPEFYLVDDEGQGHWFPCQAAGSRAFGEIPEHRPILQKGDNFDVPEKPREKVRYVAEFLTGKGGNPTVTFVRELLAGE
jgi:hypothetical protein